MFMKLYINLIAAINLKQTTRLIHLCYISIQINKSATYRHKFDYVGASTSYDRVQYWFTSVRVRVPWPNMF